MNGAGPSNSPHRILVVEDDRSSQQRVVGYFRQEGYLVEACDSAEAVEIIDGLASFDIALLDINLPGASGLELAKRLSESTDIGIILVSSRDDEIDRIIGLEIGADDYITKPFSLRELLARVKNLLRRKTPTPPQALQLQRHFGPWSLDLAGRFLFNEQTPRLQLTRAEFELLLAFLDHRGQSLTRVRLMQKITHRIWDPNERTIDVLVRRLRHKIEDNPQTPKLIITLHGEGYLLNAESL